MIDPDRRLVTLVMPAFRVTWTFAADPPPALDWAGRCDAIALSCRIRRNVAAGPRREAFTWRLELAVGPSREAGGWLMGGRGCGSAPRLEEAMRMAVDASELLLDPREECLFEALRYGSPQGFADGASHLEAWAVTAGCHGRAMLAFLERANARVALR